MKIVCKIGTSSITDAHGEIRDDAVASFCKEVAALRDDGHLVVAVTSGAIAGRSARARSCTAAPDPATRRRCKPCRLSVRAG